MSKRSSSTAAGAAFKDTWTLDDVDLAWRLKYKAKAFRGAQQKAQRGELKNE